MNLQRDVANPPIFSAERIEPSAAAADYVQARHHPDGASSSPIGAVRQQRRR